MTKGQRVAAWMNTIQHLMGDHANCPIVHLKPTKVIIRPSDYTTIGILDQFLTDTAWIAKSCISKYTTQINESFNRIKLKHATKDIRWGCSWPARMACAVLDFNWPNWKIEEPYVRLGLPPLSGQAMRRLVKKGRPKKKSHSIPPVWPEGPSGYRPNPFYPPKD
jgi:hypothetical protein